MRNLAGEDAGDRLTLNQVWTFNDPRFRGDRQYGDNRVAGLPPLSGFLGKVMLLSAAPGGATGAAIWAVFILSGFAGALAMARAGSAVFYPGEDRSLYVGTRATF